MYLVVKGWQRVLSGPGLLRGVGGDTNTHIQTHRHRHINTMTRPWPSIKYIPGLLYSVYSEAAKHKQSLSVLWTRAQFVLTV